MKKSRKVGIGIVAVVIAGSLFGGGPSPAEEELATRPNLEVRTETRAEVAKPKKTVPKVTTPKTKVTKPKTEVAKTEVTKSEATTPKAEVTKPKATKPKAAVTKPKVTKPKATKPKATKPKATKPKATKPKKVGYIINTKSGVFHKKSCHHAKKIKNPRTSTELRKELSKKYEPCKVCNP